MLLTDADRKERIARIQQSIAEPWQNRTTKSDECELSDVSPRKGQYDHHQNHHQAHFCPQVVDQAVAFVVASHGRDLPSDASPRRKALMNRKEHWSKSKTSRLVAPGTARPLVVGRKEQNHRLHGPWQARPQHEQEQHQSFLDLAQGD
jgi:hypothetical protein